MARPRKSAPEPAAPAFDPAALDALIGAARTPADVDALFRQMKKVLMERILVEVAPDLISTVTDEVLEEVTAWQQRPLESCYPVVLFDCPAGQDPRRGRGAEQGGLRGPRDHARAAPRTCWGSGSSRPRGPSSGTG